jgi:outer membrane immunogenic protein
MKKFVIATAALVAMGMSAPAFAADMYVKAKEHHHEHAYDWSGIYIGTQTGYEWARVRDTTAAGYLGDSRISVWDWGFHVGVQQQFGQFVIGVEAATNIAGQPNSTGNFVACANPAFTCGVKTVHDLVTVGGKLGYAWDRWLLAVQGGWATTSIARSDLNAAGVLNAGGGQSLARHDGAYIGASLEYVVHKGTVVDVVSGFDYQHIWINARDDLDANGVFHNMREDVDLFRARLTIKTKGWDFFYVPAVVAKN